MRWMSAATSLPSIKGVQINIFSASKRVDWNARIVNDTAKMARMMARSWLLSYGLRKTRQILDIRCAPNKAALNTQGIIANPSSGRMYEVGMEQF